MMVQTKAALTIPILQPPMGPMPISAFLPGVHLMPFNSTRLLAVLGDTVLEWIDAFRDFIPLGTLPFTVGSSRAVAMVEDVKVACP